MAHGFAARLGVKTQARCAMGISYTSHSNGNAKTASTWRRFFRFCVIHSSLILFYFEPEPTTKDTPNNQGDRITNPLSLINISVNILQLHHSLFKAFNPLENILFTHIIGKPQIG